ncbi:ABC transporter permease [Virgisporangium ochraceum]|uniref:ABC transporter permease n=1 Tax=Virgisporangium ochraceum TaxID=65505 RepID=A0A8J3ZPG3_9ACTN|nr:ABC transporter permease [Virgisporangium ochraceum]
MSTVTDRAPGYRPNRTLSFWTEFRRQAARRRTQFSLGFMVLLPLVVLGAFKWNPGGGDDDDGDGGGGFSALVDVATSGGPNFALFTLFVSSGFLLVVVVALFCGDAVASEASWGSLRYLLAVPVPRARLLAIKLLVALAYSALAILLLTGTALLAGTVFYGWNPLQAPIGGTLPPGEGVVRLLAVVGYISVTLMVVGSLAFLLSVSTDAPLGAVGGAVMIYIVSNILDQIDALGGIRDFLPTHFNEAYLGLLSTPVQTDDVVRGMVSALVYSTVLLSLAWWRFLRKDVVS